jgi:L-fucose dehydrogenase
MDLGLKDKVVIVTGGAKGIGAAVSRAFADEGAVPVILGRNPQEAQSLVTSLAAAGLRADSIEQELTDLTALEQSVAEVVDRHGRIDVVVNNAAVNDGAGLDAGTDQFVRSLERNLIHVFALVRHCLPHLTASTGNIVNIGSKVATTGQGGTSGYAAAKGALNALTREWAVDLAPRGVRVNAVIPAEVWTEMYERWIAQQDDPDGRLKAITSCIPLGRRFTTPAEIAATTVFVASERSSHTTGQILYVDGGYTHLDRAATVSGAG